ncbi:hypothetical protein DFH07DRAFT_936793 [Mycena maculata]|uniref:F-box domain-containing protein n=1 Tax=Mycena maculata TaxID=230809 RepID=A0AAD7K4B5_9AGAR|nr:hypothetical protein DFH07DRAFT_936793 [Mycena maculata]
MSQGTESGASHRSETHRSLRIPEVVNQICSQLDSVPGAGAATLATLARTSSLFHDAALDALWSRQNTLMNLIYCLPSDLFEYQDLRFLFGTGLLTINRPIIASDWGRVLKYSGRVKCLKLTQDREPNLLSFFQALRLCVPGDYLLPNLQVLLWGFSDANSIFIIAKSLLPFIDLFLGPRIISIGIGSLNRKAHYSLLPDIARRYPALTGVGIGTDDEDDGEEYYEEDDESPRVRRIPPADQLSAFVRALTHAENLAVGMLDLPALMHVGKLETLRSLAAELPPSVSFPPEHRLRALFPCLHVGIIKINKGDILSLTQFVRTWNSPRLEYFNVEFKGDDRRNFTGSLFQQRTEELNHLLGEHCIPDSLRTFRFHISDGWRDRGSFVYPGHLLRPLSCFSNLVSVSIGVLHGFDIDDVVLSDLARAWPHLQELSLATEKHESTPRATLCGLQALAQHCAKLRTVEITFDATNVPPVTTDEPQIVQRNLVSLNVAFSPIAAAFPVARYLSGTFVNLKEIETHFASQYQSKWTEVGDILELIEVRADERARERNSALQNAASATAPITLEPSSSQLPL